MENIIQRPQSYRWSFYALGPGTYARRFPGNSILFVNGGTTTITINNQIMPAVLGTAWGLPGNKNEVDLTVYQIQIPTGGLLYINVKEDSGIVKHIITEEEPTGTPHSRRKIDKDL